MEIRAVGTSGGKTVSNRLTTFLVDGTFCIDAGSVCTGLSLEEQLQIRHVFVSHVHMDHIGELPLLVDNMGMYGHALTVYATEPTVRFLKESIFNGIIWPDFTRIPSVESPALKFVAVDYGNPIDINGFTLNLMPVNHIEGSAGCHLWKNGKGLVYTSDTGITDGVWEYVNRSEAIDAVITECSFPAEMNDLAERSLHLSSASLPLELKKIRRDCRVLIYHLKPQFADQIRLEIEGLPVTVLADDDVVKL